jgi:hypothetical protein
VIALGGAIGCGSSDGHKRDYLCPGCMEEDPSKALQKKHSCRPRLLTKSKKPGIYPSPFDRPETNSGATAAESHLELHDNGFSF